jgi:hypothetical protein
MGIILAILGILCEAMHFEGGLHWVWVPLGVILIFLGGILAGAEITK